MHAGVLYAFWGFLSSARPPLSPSPCSPPRLPLSERWPPCGGAAHPAYKNAKVKGPDRTYNACHEGSEGGGRGAAGGEGGDRRVTRVAWMKRKGRVCMTRVRQSGNEVVTTTLTDSRTWTQEASPHFVFHFTLIFPFTRPARSLSTFPVALCTSGYVFLYYLPPLPSAIVGVRWTLAGGIFDTTQAGLIGRVFERRGDLKWRRVWWFGWNISVYSMGIVWYWRGLLLGQLGFMTVDQLVNHGHSLTIRVNLLYRLTLAVIFQAFCSTCDCQAGIGQILILGSLLLFLT